MHFVTDDGRRWLRLNPARRFDAVVSNTTYHFRANASNLLSSEFLALIKNHLKHGGVLFYNTTDSARVQRTGCLAFPYGARFTNHMVLSSSPISWDFDRWRHTLEVYQIDGSPVINAARVEDRVTLARLMSLNAVIHADSPGTAESPFEPCEHIMRRTAGQDPVTDDNMGTEWRYFWGRE